MTTATTFSRQNDAGSRASTTYYWENLVLVVVLVLESKALYLSYKDKTTRQGTRQNGQKFGVCTWNREVIIQIKAIEK